MIAFISDIHSNTEALGTVLAVWSAAALANDGVVPDVRWVQDPAAPPGSRPPPGACGAPRPFPGAPRDVAIPG